MRGRLCTEQGENFQAIKQELKSTNIDVPKENPVGPNGLFLTKLKTAEAVTQAPDQIKDQIAKYYENLLRSKKSTDISPKLHAVTNITNNIKD